MTVYTKILTPSSALGIELALAEQGVIVFTTLALALYFLVKFVLSGISDYLIWRIKKQSYLDSVDSYLNNLSYDDQQKEIDSSRVKNIAWLYSAVDPLSNIRLYLFEFSIPILLALYAIYGLVKRLYCE